MTCTLCFNLILSFIKMGEKTSVLISRHINPAHMFQHSAEQVGQLPFCGQAHGASSQGPKERVVAKTADYHSEWPAHFQTIFCLYWLDLKSIYFMVKNSPERQDVTIFSSYIRIWKNKNIRSALHWLKS